MHALPEPLWPLASYAQFIVWQAVWNETKNKYEKYPVCPVTLQKIDHLHPSSWMDYNTAQAMAASAGLGVGFILTANDPFFCIDIDNALLASGAWSPFALELCGAFAGAAVEVSYSGAGLHIFGVGQWPEKHRCKRDDLGLEFYTEGRFIAITGTGAVGSAATDCTPGLSYLIEKYLPRRLVFGTEDWTTEPVPDWDGIADDEKLIVKMLNSKPSAAAILGGRASFRDLWEANDNVLSVAYPSKSGDAYNRSGADAALCQHLAFWTGKNCERIERLFSISGLVRDKWRDREAYRYDTVTSAASWCKEVHKIKRKVEAPEPAPYGAGSEVEPGVIRDGFQYLGLPQQLEYFRGCVYVSKLHAVFTPRGELLRPDQFKATYGGYWFAMDSIGDKSTKNAWEAFTESQGVRFPSVDTICFRPEIAPGAIVDDAGITSVNTYVAVSTPRVAGDASPFLEHLTKLLPVATDRAILLAYMAAIVQHKGAKFQWCPFIQGAEGNGKTLFTRCIMYAVGRRYSHLPSAADIANKFNEWMWGKLFIGVEDVYTADRQECLETLKPMITGTDIDIQGKGKAQFTGDNRANFILNSNHKDGVRKTLNDRRFAPFFTAQQSKEDIVRDGMGGGYFQRLYAWLREEGFAIVHEYLATYPIPDELNPALGGIAPVTSSTSEAVHESLGGVEQEVLEAIAQGSPGFAGGWISSVALDRLLEHKNMARRIHPNKRRALLESIGYIHHPHLTDGRATCIVAMDGGTRPRLYIRKDSLACQLRGGIVDAYIKAQAVGGPENLAATIFNGAK